MSNLLIKDVPAELVQGAKMSALASGQTLRSWVMQVIGNAAQHHDVKPAKVREVPAPVRNEPANDNEGPAAVDLSAHTTTKPRANRKQASATPRQTAVDQSAQPKPCRHGLMYHADCEA